MPCITVVYSLLPSQTAFSLPYRSKAIITAPVNITPIIKLALLKLQVSSSQILYLALTLATRQNQLQITLGSLQRALLQSYLRLNFTISSGQRLTNVLGQFRLTWPRLRLARKELAILAIAASLRGNPRATSLSMCLTITCSSVFVRFCELAIVSAREGRPARRLRSVVSETLQIDIARFIESLGSLLRALTASCI